MWPLDEDVALRRLEKLPAMAAELDRRPRPPESRELFAPFGSAAGNASFGVHAVSFFEYPMNSRKLERLMT